MITTTKLRFFVFLGLLSLTCSCERFGKKDNAPNHKFGQTPTSGLLSAAVAANDLPRVRDLVAAGADVNENIGTEGEQITPIMISTARGYREIALFLVHEGARTTDSFKEYDARDFAAYVFGGSDEIVKIIDGAQTK